MFDPQAFIEAIGTVVAIIAQASVVDTSIARTNATVGQGGMSNLQRFQAHHPPTYMGGGDSMVMTDLAIEIEVDDTRSIKNMGSSAKRKENQSSSRSRKKQKTSALHGSQGQGRGHQGQDQGQSFRGGRHFRAPSQSRQRACLHCHQPGNFRRDFPQRQGP